MTHDRETIAAEPDSVTVMRRATLRRLSAFEHYQIKPTLIDHGTGMVTFNAAMLDRILYLLGRA